MLTSCFFFHWYWVHLKEKLQENFPETAWKNTEAFLWSNNIFNKSRFNTFPGISQNLPENVSIFFAKMIYLCLLTQKNQTLQGVIGRNIDLWQNLWVGEGRFERQSSSARASLALCGRFNQFRSPYSWITMRRALRKRRVFDFVPSYLKLGSKYTK